MIVYNFMYNFFVDLGNRLLSLSPYKPIREWGTVKNKRFVINDMVKLTGNPFDEQIVEELLLYMFLKDKHQRVTMTMDTHEEGTSGLWIRTDMMHDWVDAAWFEKV